MHPYVAIDCHGSATVFPDMDRRLHGLQKRQETTDAHPD